MAKYKITFTRKDRELTRSCENGAECSDVAYHFDQKDIKYTAKKYAKENGKYGWITYSPSNHCRRCGRELTNPKSVQHGIGPECIKHIGRNSHFPESNLETKVLHGVEATKVLESIPSYNDHCKFCNGNLDTIVYYYEHEGGWFVESIGKKVWLWVECISCGHQWSLQHLGVSRSIIFTSTPLGTPTQEVII